MSFWQPWGEWPEEARAYMRENHPRLWILNGIVRGAYVGVLTVSIGAVVYVLTLLVVR